MARRNNDTEDLMDEDVDDGGGMVVSEVDDMSAGGTGSAGRSTGASKRRPARRCFSMTCGRLRRISGLRRPSSCGIRLLRGARSSAGGGSRKMTAARKVGGAGSRKSTSGRKSASPSSGGGARKAASRKR